MTPFMYL